MTHGSISWIHQLGLVLQAICSSVRCWCGPPLSAASVSCSRHSQLSVSVRSLSDSLSPAPVPPQARSATAALASEARRRINRARAGTRLSAAASATHQTGTGRLPAGHAATLQRDRRAAHCHEAWPQA